MGQADDLNGSILYTPKWPQRIVRGTKEMQLIKNKRGDPKAELWLSRQK